jgi:hypothetical protein
MAPRASGLSPSPKERMPATRPLRPTAAVARVPRSFAPTSPPSSAWPLLLGGCRATLRWGEPSRRPSRTKRPGWPTHKVPSIGFKESGLLGRGGERPNDGLNGRGRAASLLCDEARKGETRILCIKRPLARFRMRSTLVHMTDEQFERYMDLCKRLFEKMRRENAWPWLDSPDFGDVVESEDNKDDV